MSLLKYSLAALTISSLQNVPLWANAGPLLSLSTTGSAFDAVEAMLGGSATAKAQDTTSAISSISTTLFETWTTATTPLVSQTSSISAASRPQPEGSASSKTSTSKISSKASLETTTTGSKTASRTSSKTTAKATGTARPTGNATRWNPIIADPKKGPSFQIILSGVPNIPAGARKITPNTDIYDIDLFHTEKSVITQLKSMNKTVICYFSGGTYEPGRPDTRKFVRADQGSRLPQWPREKWLKLGSTDVRRLMADRIQLASEKGCDGIDPDNVDGYAAGQGGGLGLKKYDSIQYIKFLSRTAAKYGMATGLKNALDIIKDVLPDVKFAVNEECIKANECDAYLPFVKDKKPVFHIEYPVSDLLKAQDPVSRNHWCAGRSSRGLKNNPWFQTVIKQKNLDGWVTFCDGSVATTPIHDTDGRYSNLRFIDANATAAESAPAEDDPSDYMMTAQDEKVAREDGYPYAPGRGSESFVPDEELLDYYYE